MTLPRPLSAVLLLAALQLAALARAGRRGSRSSTTPAAADLLLPQIKQRPGEVSLFAPGRLTHTGADKRPDPHLARACDMFCNVPY